MRRSANVLLVAAVVAVGAVAVIDALRSDGAGPSTPQTSQLQGQLVWSDRECRRHAVRLRDLARRDFRTVGCSVFSRSDNLGVRDGEVAWFAFPGGSTLLLSRADIAAEVGEGFRAREAAWLGDLRYAAILSGPRDVIGLFQRDDLVAQFGDLRPGAGGLRASPSGRVLAVLDERGVELFSRDGEAIAFFQDARAIAWSPDEQHAVLARPQELLIVRARGGDEVATLPYDALDVDWRA